MNTKINGKDIYATWGAIIEDSSINALFLPPAAKNLVENTNRAINGTQVIDAPLLVEAREIQLVFAFNRGESFRMRAASLVAELMKGVAKLEVHGVSFYVVYRSAKKLATLKDTLGTLAVSLFEPNPSRK